ncbi:MAG: hypothetical protein IPK14_14085 [Blastocatellia bacterium]|nr:hypothetical protein [Blastocatellia bacterium]
MRNKITFLLLLFVLTSALAMAGDTVAPNIASMFTLANLMPKGALVYVQSKDLTSQLKAWYLSPAHKRYFASSNYNAFSQSRLFLKFQERVQEFEAATGIVLSEEGFASVVGGESALALYDIGELEFVFATELPQAKLASSILAQKGDKLSTRKTAGVTYYLKSMKAEDGAENRTFVIAIVGSRGIVTTSEVLMQRALKNNADAKSEDKLLDTVLDSAKEAEGFTAHDVTLWLDQTVLNKDRYFRNYWIHNNLAELKDINKVLIDLEIASDKLLEKRWLFNSEIAASTKESSLEQLLKFAPNSAQLVSVRQADGKNINQTLDAVIFGPKRAIAPLEAGYNPATSESTSEDGEEPTNSPYQRYISLDQRFDQDIDSPELSVNKTISDSESKFFAALSEVLAQAKPVRFALFAEPQVETNSSFVSFNRAVIVEFEKSDSLSKEKLEKLISDELKQRFVVTGNNVNFNWQTGADNSRSLSRVLIEHGGAYLLEKNYLIFANSENYLIKLITSSKTPNSEKLTTSPNLTRFALVRVRGSKSPFDKLMRRLDGLGLSTTPIKQNNNQNAESEDSEVDTSSGSDLLFSQNISSLIGVVADVNLATLEQTTSNGVIKEQVSYRFAGKK